MLPGGFRLLIGHDLGDRARIGAVMVRALAISLVFFAALAALGALFVARRVLRRIDAINISAHGIMAGDLTQRLPVSGSGDELDRLAEGLNEMLARIGELMQGLREVSDNIAHDLRTPLTRLRNHAEAALAFGGDAAAYRIALEKTIEEFGRAHQDFQCASADRPRRGRRRRRGAAAVRRRRSRAEASPNSTSRSPRRRASRLKVETEGALTVVANRELIAQTIANLVDNALKYGAPQRPAPKSKPEVVISARRVGGVGRFDRRRPGSRHRASPTGPRVLERFVRLEGSRSRPGSGLGLSLAAAVARMHGGAVELEDNEPGLRVRVTLPAEDGAAAAAGAGERGRA